MATLRPANVRGWHGVLSARAATGRARMSMATKLVLSYVLIIAIATAAFSIAGTQLLGRVITSEAETAVRNHLNAAREIVLGRLRQVNDVVRLTAGRFYLREALSAGRIGQAADELTRIRRSERLDILSVTDRSGRVLLRTSNPASSGDSRGQDELVATAARRKEAVAAVAIMPAADLRKESPLLAERAAIRFVDTPRARLRGETAETAGMLLQAAAPVMDGGGEVLGIVYGGILLNKNPEIVDKIKHTVFQNVVYKGKDIGTSTIFLDDVRISTNVLNLDGTRAIGTRGAEDVYNRVVVEGRPWIGRAFVVNDWYITAYEPIHSLTGRIIGILYVGVLEQKYVDMRRQTVAMLLSITFAVGLASMVLAYHTARRVSTALAGLAGASQEMARGNLDVRVDIAADGELQDLADAFNAMASSLRARNEQLKEFTRRKIMESERLAVTGQLAAGVAHELNNPLQGIVAYAHLLLESTPADSAIRPSLQKIVNQADRCREIIRGLLDFARPRRPQMRPASVNTILQECISLVENQATFHNIVIAKDFQEDLPTTVMDPSQMQQVFMNLIVNAAEAMDGVGSLSLATRLDPAGMLIDVEITDTGHGIRPEDLDKIFDPFFTTKPPGHGVGLGLAISYGIIREHNGTISVKSEVGSGTTFTINLPVTGGEDA